MNMDAFLDSAVNDNYKVLPNLLESLIKERDKLKKQLFGINVEGTTGENEWDKVASETRKTIQELQEVEKQCEEIHVASIEEKDQDGLAVCEKILPKLRELDDIERVRKYLVWIRRVNKISNEVSAHLSRGNIDQSVSLFMKLCEANSTVSSSSCSHLKEFVKGVCEDRRTQLKEALSNQYNEFLKIVSWPFPKDMSSKSLETWNKKQPEFLSIFKHLTAIDKIQLDCSRQPHIPDIDDPLILPIELLVNPLRKRFRYHFYGDRKTNAKDKPEWYFTQVSQWISENTPFLQTHIQPHLGDTQYRTLNVKLEFIRGLIQELFKKVRHELSATNSHTMNDDYLFSHLIDELLLFDKEVCTVHNYPDVYPRCIAVVQDESILCRWRNLEKQFAAEKLKAITESPSAWEPAYGTLTEGGEDETKVPECAERFMQLIAGITERYKQVPILLLRLQFLELQSDLLLEFSQDLSSAIKINASSPLSNGFIAYLNASNYIGSLLKQWAEETFFLELHYYHKYLSTNRQSTDTETIAQLEALRKVDPDFAELEGTAFQEVIQVFDSFCDDMIDVLVSHCINDLKSKSNGYRKERWHNFPVSSDQIFDLSPSALDFLVHLQHLLHFLKSSISPLLQDKLFDKFILRLDEFLLHQIIYFNKFNRGGAEQIHYDITQVIKPLAIDCLKGSYLSATILRRTNDACCILKQPSSYTDMLRSLLQLSLSGNDDSAYQEVMSLLNEKGITSLSLEEVLQVTSLLVD